MIQGATSNIVLNTAPSWLGNRDFSNEIFRSVMPVLLVPKSWKLNTLDPGYQSAFNHLCTAYCGFASEKEVVDQPIPLDFFLGNSLQGNSRLTTHNVVKISLLLQDFHDFEIDKY